jgi:preprotein translocase subunit SecD
MDKRIDGLGIFEPIIRTPAINQMEIQLLGISSHYNSQILKAIKKPDNQEFMLVHPSRESSSLTDADIPAGYEILNKEHEDVENWPNIKHPDVL